MSSLHDWPYLLAAFAGLTLITVFTRASFFLLPASFSLPAWAERALRYAPACALAAIVAPSVLAPGHHVHVGWSNHQLWAAVVATLVFLRTRNMVVMMVVGMAVFTALRLWL